MFINSLRRFVQQLRMSNGRRRRIRRIGYRLDPNTPCVERLEMRLTPTPVTTTWTGANFHVDHNWSDPKNWSNGVPGASDTAAFTDVPNVTKFFTCNVDVTTTVSSWTMDKVFGSGGGTIYVNSSLTVTGNFQIASGHLYENGAIKVSGTNSDWVGGEITLGAGGFVNTGTMTADTTGSNLVLDFGGTLTNQGTFDVAGTHTLYLEHSAVINNTATLNFTGDSTIGQLFGGTLNNSKLIEKTGGTGVSTITSTFNSTGGTFDAAKGTLTVSSFAGLINSGSLHADSGATISLAGAGNLSYTGAFTGSGSGTVALNSATLVVPKTGVSFLMPGSLFQWSAGLIDLSSGGTMTIQSSGALNLNGTGMQLKGAGYLNNFGTINLGGATNLNLMNGAAFHNETGGTIDFTSNSAIGTDGSQTGGPLTNDGLIEKTAGTGTSTIYAMFNNHNAALTVDTGTLAIKGAHGLINGGKFTVAGGATLNLSAGASPTTYAGSFSGSGVGTVALTQSTLAVGSGGVTFNLPGSMFNWSGGTIDASQGSFTNGGIMTIATSESVKMSGAGSFINGGNLILNPGSVLTVGGSFTESSTATLTEKLGLINGAPLLGSVTSMTEKVTIAGQLMVESSAAPAVGSTFAVENNVANSKIVGTFSGLAEGSTISVADGAKIMKFKISYMGKIGNCTNNITLTRIA